MGLNTIERVLVTESTSTESGLSPAADLDSRVRPNNLVTLLGQRLVQKRADHLTDLARFDRLAILGLTNRALGADLLVRKGLLVQRLVLLSLLDLAGNVTHILQIDHLAL